MNLTEDQHSELFLLIEELRGLTEAGYVTPTDPFLTRLNRMNEILWDIYLV